MYQVTWFKADGTMESFTGAHMAVYVKFEQWSAAMSTGEVVLVIKPVKRQ